MKTKIIRHKIDWIFVAVTLLNTAIILIPFVVQLSTSQIYAYALMSFLFRIVCPLHQHNHGHLKTFHNRRLNNLYDIPLCLVTGFTTSGWELQHNQGHHVTLLKPGQDVISLNRFNCEDGRFISRIKFTLLGDMLAYFDCVRIGHAQWMSGNKKPLNRFLIQFSYQLAMIAVLVYLKPLEAFWIVIIPAILCRWAVFFVAYDHHLHTDLTSVYSACNNLRWQYFMLNLGYHTAHHEKPTLHWTLLPARTYEIQKKFNLDRRVF